MNSNVLTISSVLAAAAAVILLPVSTAAAAFTFTAVGILSVLVSDYSRTFRPFSPRAEIIPFNSTGRPSALLREAA